MYGLSGAVESFGYIKSNWSSFKFLATKYMQMRNTLSQAQARGVPVERVRAVMNQIDSLERDYRAARARTSEPGGNVQLHQVSPEGFQNVMMALFKRTELLNDSVVAVTQAIPQPETPEQRPGILENLSNTTKWLAIGGVAYVAYSIFGKRV